MPLPDPRDAALGVCEPCRSGESSFSSPAAGGSSAETVELVVEPPNADLPGEPAAARRVESAKAEGPLPARRPVENAMRPEASQGRARLVVGGVLALALASTLAWLYAARPAWLLVRSKMRVPAPPAVEKRLPGWRLAIDTAGGAKEHFARGRRLFLEDEPASYIQAEEEFKAAVALDPSNLAAVAHYVEAFATGRGERASPEGLAEARELIAAVLAAKPDLAVAHRAKAALLLAAEAYDEAPAEAAQALRLASPEEQAEALLMMGRTYLVKSAEIALERFEGALKKDRSLKRAHYYRALAAEVAGRYAQAVAALEERLRLDPDQREALRALARVHAELGDTQAARAVLAQYASKHPDVGEPRVLLVQLAYAVEGDVKEADRALRALKSDLPRFDDGDKLMYLTLGAAIARERGDGKASAELAAGALHIDPRYAPAHFQAMLTALTEGDAEEARKHLDRCEAKLEPARAAELRGRVEAEANRLEAAISALRKASELAPARVAPRLSAAALLYRKGDADAAFSVMRRALDLDPASTSSIRRCVSDYYEPSLQDVRLAKEAFEGAKPDDWLAQTYAAVAQYHLGDADRASAALDKVLQLDPSSLGALLYRAQIEIDRKRYDRALELALHAASAERQSAVAHYLVGRSLEGLKKSEEARAAYLKAIEVDPNLVPANARLGAAAAAMGDKEEARKRLLLVTSADPENLEARLALFKIGY